ncbi:hypothetical protein B0H11DRAFT_2242161 [Mycena galericulata]|nr:hypothetical protein B0H11DRAFT_2242161 [Mycena galericulata]
MYLGPLLASASPLLPVSNTCPRCSPHWIRGGSLLRDYTNFHLSQHPRRSQRKGWEDGWGCNEAFTAFILLILAHLEYYPNVPFLPRKHGSGFIEHFFGITRDFISEFSFGQLVQMNKHITFRQRILSSGKFNTKKEKDSNNGYIIHDCDSPLTADEIFALK